MPDLTSLLVKFGAEPSSLRLLDDDGPGLLPYATIVAARRNGDSALGAVEAVYEWQGAPLVFLVAADSLEDEEVQLRRIRRLLAMRGDAPYLAVVAPGSLDVYRVALDKKSPGQARVDWQGEDIARSAVFARLGNVRPKASIAPQNWISNVVLRLLTGSTRDLTNRGVPDDDAISLVGRALFTRFLADRSLLPDDMSGTKAERLFDSRDEAEETSNWLDDKFNGDLLPLSADIFEMLPEGSYGVLGNILRRAPDSQLFLGWEQKWGNLHFAHIPVGVLSQAYESYLKDRAPVRQRRQGVYYTPKPIAELMVRASFRALERRGMAKSAKILDPAAGGGMFLLTAFRELVAAHWRANRKRPDTNDLRQILYDQLVGFDINEAALRYAALGLYLLSIELDPDPRPVDKLRFADLRGRVLHRVTQTDEAEGQELGSLGPLVGDEHLAQYDLVIGNPPWASGTMLPEWQLVCATVNGIAASREIGDPSPPLPNEGLDLPFVWRAMEWAKPKGQIAFALHARLLFQQGDGMPAARQALFDALDITSLINGADLSQTRVWPGVSAPFCLLFATNRVPGPGRGFRFVSPRIEQSLNQAGAMRIDALNAEVVSAAQLRETPDVLKILFRGTKADLGIVERIRVQGHPTLAEFWRRRIGAGPGSRLLGSGSGYQMQRPSSRVRQNGDGLPGADARYLQGLREVTVASFGNIFLDPELLDTFSHERIHDPRSRNLFNGPLLVVHQSPLSTRGRIGVVISEEDVVFNETFYGYSPSGDRDAGLLVRYLALVLGSRLALWFALVTSGKFGVERRVIEKATLDRIPIPDFEKLTAEQRGEIASLVDRLGAGGVSWKDVDEWVVRLYGLGERDSQVVFDTLAFGLPFADNAQKAQEPPTPAVRKRFCAVLQDELSPWCERFGSTLGVEEITPPPMSPWQAIAVRRARGGSEEGIPGSDWEGLLRVADDAAASEVVLHDDSDRLLVARLAQNRYWSETQARLLAQRIAWTHVDLLRARS